MIKRFELARPSRKDDCRGYGMKPRMRLNGTVWVATLGEATCRSVCPVWAYVAVLEKHRIGWNHFSN